MRLLLVFLLITTTIGCGGRNVIDLDEINSEGIEVSFPVETKQDQKNASLNINKESAHKQSIAGDVGGAGVAFLSGALNLAFNPFKAAIDFIGGASMVATGTLKYSQNIKYSSYSYIWMPYFSKDKNIDFKSFHTKLSTLLNEKLYKSKDNNTDNSSIPSDISFNIQEGCFTDMSNTEFKSCVSSAYLFTRLHSNIYDSSPDLENILTDITKEIPNLYFVYYYKDKLIVNGQVNKYFLKK